MLATAGLAGGAHAAGLLQTLAAPAPAPASAPASSPAQTITLSDIVDALGTRDMLSARVNEALANTDRLDLFTPRLAEQDAAIAAAGSDVSREGLRRATFERLLDLDTQLAVGQDALVGMIDQLKDDSRTLETLFNDIRRERALWVFRADAARDRDASADFLKLVDAAPQDLEQLAEQVRPVRDRAISLLGQAVSLRSRGHDLRSELAIRRERVNVHLRDAEGPPLWTLIRTTKFPGVGAFVTEARNDWRAIFAYVGEHGATLLVLLVALFGSSVAVLRATRRALEDDTRAGAFDAERALKVLRHSGWAALLLGLLGTVVLAPRAPIAFYDVVWLFVPVPAAVLTLAALGPRYRTVIIAVAVALLALPFRSLIELSPIGERVVLLAQCLGLVGALAWDVRRHTVGAAPPARARRVQIAVVAVLLLVAAWAAVAGHVGTARTLRSGVLSTLGFAMVVLAAYEALLGIGLVALSSPWMGRSLAVQRQRPALERAWRTLLRCGAWVTMAFVPVIAFGFADRLPAAVDGVMNARLQVGEAGISVGALVAGFAALGGTWLVVKVVRLLLDDEILPRFNLGQGLPFAISALTRYAIALLGLIFALAASGIDLSKMALLAGAVGVGIGFGLQNIINNFVSGLVLLVERPMHVGDLVETPTATGFVQRIGFRASVIRTTDGADIVVPNGDLLSKELLNWTLSNRERRIRIDVNVAYRADPATVIRLLCDVAAAHPSVMASPAPFALCTDFADSAIAFRLLAWVADANDAGSIASDLRERVLARLREAGIDMPFPQREVLLRTGAAGAIIDVRETPPDPRASSTP